MKLTKKLLLASGSPRRKEILSQAGFDFEIEVRPTDEDFPENLQAELVPEFLAKNKAKQFHDVSANKLVICADTVVILDNKILNKPQNKEEAFQMLSDLSGKQHKVVTGVCIKEGDLFHSFSDTAHVFFAELSSQEIDYYIEKYQPFDKAGSYGVQDFIGMIGINRIEGSFYTIMGLPIHKLYIFLKQYQ